MSWPDGVKWPMNWAVVLYASVCAYVSSVLGCIILGCSFVEYC